MLDPLLSVITNIGLEHTNFLGNTLESIASEKAGIIKDEKNEQKLYKLFNRFVEFIEKKRIKDNIE